MSKLIKNILNERRSFILVFTFIAFAFVFLNFSNFIVETYNEDVKRQQIEKKHKADGGKGFGFYACNFGAPLPHIQSRLLNLLIFFVSVLLLLKISFWKTFFSLLVQFLSLTHFFFWFLDSYVRYFYIKREFSEKTIAEEFASENFTFPFRYLYSSSYLDFVVLAFVIIMIFWQVSILYCFARAKFQAKLSPR